MDVLCNIPICAEAAINLSILDFKCDKSDRKLVKFTPINLSILDFKYFQVLHHHQPSYAINLSILDFK
mgnify:CR=1 FL=1